jgi:nucleoside triphosphatase
MIDQKYPEPTVGIGETMEHAVIREVKEETGLDIYDVEQLNTQDAINPDGFYKEAHYIFTDFVAKTKDTEPKLDEDEATSYVWVTPEEGLRIGQDYVKKSIKKWMEKHDTNRK